MDEVVLKKFEEQDEKLSAIYVSVEKTRKYFLIVTWVTIALVVLPAIGLVFAIPAFLSTYAGSLDGLL
ncbi:MAG: hypothetical protein O2794_01915 [bacterium]|nr:hypothetical protein [bacterium]